MNKDNVLALVADLFGAFPDETVQAGQRLKRSQAAFLNAAILRAKDIDAAERIARDKAISDRD